MHLWSCSISCLARTSGARGAHLEKPPPSTPRAGAALHAPQRGDCKKNHCPNAPMRSHAGTSRQPNALVTNRPQWARVHQAQIWPLSMLRPTLTISARWFQAAPTPWLPRCLCSSRSSPAPARPSRHAYQSSWQWRAKPANHSHAPRLQPTLSTRRPGFTGSPSPP